MVCSEYMIRDYDTGELVSDGFGTCAEAVSELEEHEFITGIRDGDEILIGTADDFA